MTDEEFLIKLGSMVKSIGDNTSDQISNIMSIIANKLNESRAITPEYIARLEKRISDLENK